MTADSLSLDGKVAVITGGARGQGAEEAMRFNELGARVVLADVLDEDGEALASKLGERAAYRHLDISDPEQWAALMAWVVAEWGRLDVLVNNAAIWATAPIEEQPIDGFDRIISVNLRGTFLGVQAAIAPMRASGGGSIVNIASVAGVRGIPGHAAYGASKWGVRGIGQVAAVELGPDGIRVNTIMPGIIDTPMISSAAGAAAMSVEHLPLRRIGQPNDVAGLVVFLASDASSFITGAEITVDGGSTSSLHRSAPPAGPRAGS
jgi:3alpha(or 20beta)-hydroxysteroid dehydrogenase